jgi:hypothetical protein
VKAVKRSKTDVDESTDMSDTIEWLLANVPSNNGRVGVWGISYLGFYTVTSCIDAHPAIKACSPQAPMIDVADGDDLYHNGAFLLAHDFPFFASFNRGPRTGPGPEQPPGFEPGTKDGYRWFLDVGPLQNLERIVFQGTGPDWTELTHHPNYDDFWKARNLRPHLKHLKPAFLYVGGWYDTEDLFGALTGYRTTEANNPGIENRLVMGPWYHGQWVFDDGSKLGSASAGGPTTPFFLEHVLLPFFTRHLKDKPADGETAEAVVFETGSNQWRRYPAWPPPEATRRSLYLEPDGKLSFSPSARVGFDEYPSDPARPVPVVDWLAFGLPAEYMVADQRFASRRPDVLVYRTDPLERDVTIAGPVAPTLHVATTGTDADFMVKLIDEYPADAPDEGATPPVLGFAGYQRLVRGEPFRGKFRRDRSKPVPFVPDRPDSLHFVMPDVNHTFRKGHRIMVQVQSTWFPLIDRNPQTFVPNIFFARAEDFRKAAMRVYHGPNRASRLDVSILP